jgi:site-specific recombinase XerD
MANPRRQAGVLARHVEGYRAWLVRHGYTAQTIKNMLKDLGQVGLWLSGRGLDTRDLDEERLEQHLSDLRSAGRRRVAGPRGMVPLLTFLREVGVVPAARVSKSPAETLLERYRSWMESERGLSASTMLRYEKTARRFLAEQAMAGGVFAPEGLTGADLNAFLLRECARVSAGSAKGRVAELRSLMRFLHLHGVTAIKLGGAVPPVGGWRFASVPSTMAPGDVQRLLEHTCRQGPAGVRDYAILMLVARLGLRSVEVARLLLDDVDWRCGEIAVRGKGRREGRLPLPADVGEALVAYLSGALHIRETKFGKSRLVPLHDSVMNALREYDTLRGQLMPRPRDPSFFVSLTARRLIYAVVCPTFRTLVDAAGVGLDAPHPPRLHELRHTFAVRTLLHWYRTEGNVQAKIPSLSTYMGHREPACTCWYLSAAPELLALAAARRDDIRKAPRS